MTSLLHVFKDEWMVRAAQKTVGAAVVDRLRARRFPYLGQALLSDGALTEAALYEMIAASFRVKSVTQRSAEPERTAVTLVPERVCRGRRMVPMNADSETIEMAMEDPTQMEALSDVEFVSGRRPIPNYCLPDRLDGLLSRAFNAEHVVFDMIERLQEDTPVEVLSAHTDPEKDDAPVIRLIHSTIAKAVALKASDIHIEHDERATTVRYRIDGGLRVMMSLPKHIGAGPIVSRIKIMANLDISDRMRPQDGRAKLRVGGADIGLRVSTLPTSNGEKVVIRILDKRAAEVPFDKLGIRDALAKRLAALSEMSQGLLLVTGPTGSGKTTTLYSMLNRLKSDDTNIVTAEDPIEYRIDGLNQVQVQEKQGLTFAAVLRSVLRQDPDIILVGEIRDKETAEIALQAASTGHLVFSTLHTNDAMSTLARLSDMGVERFKLAPALIGVTAQRLLRALCAHCRQRVETADIEPRLAAAMRAAGLEPACWKAKGCPECDGSGYRGRVMLVELLELDAPLRERISAGETVAALSQAAVASGRLSTLTFDALCRLNQGLTSLEEAKPYMNLAGSETPSTAPVPAPPSAPAPAPASAPAGPLKGKKILVVDDDSTIRTILRLSLEEQGSVVIEAADGDSALMAVKAESPDMLIVDLMMPKMDGYGVIREVRQKLALTELPIVILSNDAEDQSQENAFNLGADDYIVKPVRPNLVLTRINAVFRRRGA